MVDDNTIVSADVLHVACVGLMAAGKSSIGRILADRLGWAFVDVDDAIEARTGMTVAEVAEARGPEAYRPLERAVVVEALEERERSVLAAPGSVALDPTARAAVESEGVVAVYLRADPATLAARVAEDDDHGRPLLGNDPLGVLRAMFRERDGIYRELAELVVQVDARTPDEVAELVLDALSGVVVRRPRAVP